MRSVAVPVTLLAELVENVKRVVPRGAVDGDHLHHLVIEGERLLGHRQAA